MRSLVILLALATPAAADMPDTGSGPIGINSRAMHCPVRVTCEKEPGSYLTQVVGQQETPRERVARLTAELHQAQRDAAAEKVNEQMHRRKK